MKIVNVIVNFTDFYYSLFVVVQSQRLSRVVFIRLVEKKRDINESDRSLRLTSQS